MFRTGFAVAALAFATTAVLAQSGALEQRNALMKSVWRDAWRPVTQMVRGQEPYEQAKVDAAFAKLAEIAAKLPPLWPANSIGVAPDANFSSSAKIWENKADFEAKLANFTKAVNENRSKAKNLDELKTVYQVVNKTCDDCHESYRVRVR
ncbi:MAG: cytochrome c [Variibacter sp.]|nr:cytochrome c [Variibacter sp.]